MVRDADELLEKMNQDESRQAMQDAREQVEQAREQLQKAAESLANSQTSSALNSGTRAEQTMKEVREQIRQESSTKLQESMQNVVQKARDLEATQQKLQQELNQRATPTPDTFKNPSDKAEEGNPADSQSEQSTDAGSPLRPESDIESNSSREQWRSQKEKLEQLLEEIKDVVADAESSEPLLADNLYEGFREAKQSGIDRQVEQIPMLLDRGFENRAQQLASDATQGITKLKEKIETAAESVLGSEQESLRRALSEIDRANRQLTEEIESNSDRDSNPGSESGTREPSSERLANDAGQPATQPQSSDPNSNTTRPQENEEAQSGLSSRPSDRSRENSRASISGRDRNNQSIDSRPATPLTGDDYRDWIDSLRDVEELLIDPERKADVARIREAAREMRVEYKRHAKEPQWDLVRKLIADPLKELRSEVSDELMRLAAERNALVPIDRDPVPRQYEKQLDRYYENLGRG